MANNRLPQSQRLRLPALLAARRHNAHIRKSRERRRQHAQPFRVNPIIIGQKYVRHNLQGSFQLRSQNVKN
jgi:hypothetical protein